MKKTRQNRNLEPRSDSIGTEKTLDCGNHAPVDPGMETCVAGRVQPRQLAFALPHAESLTRDNFLEGPANAAGLALVDSWPEWPNRIMLLVGPEGSGKSHLAAIWAEQAGARSTTARALTAAAVQIGRASCRERVW